MLIADVSGHGSGVATIATDLRGLMRRYINDHDHTRFVRSLNQEFTDSSAAGIFATAVALTYESPGNSLQLCNAGHPPPLHFRADTGLWTLLEPGQTGNVPLGIDSAVKYQQM
ncbi:MAG TPA: PP2C family protein-serine/threonine phosphatase, partial [Tepidisphaeraceae bacterium]